MESSDSSDIELEEYDFQEFVENTKLPQTVKVTDGCVVDETRSDDEDENEVGFPTGDVITLLRLVHPNDVQLSFFDVASGRKTITASADSYAQFNILPYDPVSGDREPSHVFRTVADLVQACPPTFLAGCSYRSAIDGKAVFNKGDRLKAIRLKRSDGTVHLECKKIKGTTVFYLPMECRGDFTALLVRDYFTLNAIMSSLIPCQRRLKLADDVLNSRHNIAGLPSKFMGEIIVDCPKPYVEICHSESPGDVTTLPVDWEMRVSVRDEDYFSVDMQPHFMLSDFVMKNSGNLPMKIRVIGWDESTDVMDSHGVKPGIEMKLVKCEPVLKALLSGPDSYYALPLHNSWRFSLCPGTFLGVAEVRAVKPVSLLRVEIGAPCIILGLSPLEIGDVLKYVGEEEYQCSEGTPIRVVRFAKYFLNGQPVGTTISVPDYLGGRFVEFGDLFDNDYSLKEIVTDMSLPVTIKQVVSEECDYENLTLDPTQKFEITCCISDVCLWANTEKYLFHLPLRSKLFVICIEMLDKSSIVTAEGSSWSMWNDCPEVLSSETFHELKATAKLYEDLMVDQEEAPKLPPRSPLQQCAISYPEVQPMSRWTPVPQAQAAPRPAARRSAEKSKRTPDRQQPSVSTKGTPTDNRYGQLSKPTTLPKPPAVTSKVTSEVTSEDENEYEEVDDYDYCNATDVKQLAGDVEKTVKIPKSGNLYNFSVAELATFFRSLNVEEHVVARLKNSQVDGKKFAAMTDVDMNMYGLSNNTVVQHFKSTTKPQPKLRTMFHKLTKRS